VFLTACEAACDGGLSLGGLRGLGRPYFVCSEWVRQSQSVDFIPTRRAAPCAWRRLPSGAAGTAPIDRSGSGRSCQSERAEHHRVSQQLRPFRDMFSRPVLRHGGYGDRSESRSASPLQILLWLALFVLAKPVLTLCRHARGWFTEEWTLGRAAQSCLHASELYAVDPDYKP